MERIPSSIPSLQAICRQNAAKSPDALAFADRQESITWGAFDERSSRIANGLRARGIEANRVAFLCEASVRHTAVLFGALKAGCVVSNLHTRSPPAVLRYVIDELKPDTLVVDAENTERVHEALDEDALDAIPLTVVIGEPRHDYHVRYNDLVATEKAEEPAIIVEEDDIAYIFWTSGSTGRPKGWCHTHRSQYLKGMKMLARTGADPGGTALASFSPSFGAWFNLILKATIGCEGVYFLRDWSAERWLDVADSNDITFAGLVVTMWREILEQDIEAYDLSSLSTIYTTGEKIESETLERLREKICENVYQTYGSTEMTGTTIYDSELSGERVASVGKEQMGSELRIIEPNGHPDEICDLGEVGEIIIRGPDTPACAWRNAEVTREAFRDGWWFSKDLGYRDEDGYVYLEGRADAMIKSRGVKVMPEPVEGALHEHPGVKTAVVVGIEDDEYGERITAIVVPATDDIDSETLDEWCLEHDEIADYERPREYVFTEGVEKTPSGKIDREATKSAFVG